MCFFIILNRTLWLHSILFLFFCHTSLQMHKASGCILLMTQLNFITKKCEWKFSRLPCDKVGEVDFGLVLYEQKELLGLGRQLFISPFCYLLVQYCLKKIFREGKTAHSWWSWSNYIYRVVNRRNINLPLKLPLKQEHIYQMFLTCYECI